MVVNAIWEGVDKKGERGKKGRRKEERGGQRESVQEQKIG